MWGFPKIRGLGAQGFRVRFPKIRGTLLRGPYNKDYSILGSILGFPYFWETTMYARIHVKVTARARCCIISRNA